MNKEDLSYKGLFLFSLPSILSSLLEPLSGIVDTALVGQVSTVWLGGLALAVTLISSFTWVFNFLVHASTQAIASSEEEGISESIKTALTVCLIVGLISTLFLWLAKPILFKMVGVSTGLYVHTDEYYSIRILGHVFTLLYTTLISLLRGIGRVNVSFFMVGLTTTLNGLFTYFALFVFETGLAGAAWGTVGSFILGTIFSAVILLRDKKVSPYFFKSRVKRDRWFQFGRNSVNIFGRSLTLTTCFFLATRFASEMGIKYLAAHQILLQVWLFCSFLLDGVAVTGTVLGARYFSQKNMEKIRIVFRRLLEMGALIGVTFTLAYAFGGNLIIGLFSSDSEVVKLIFSFWIVIYLSQTINSLAFVYDGLLFGLEEFAYLRKHMIIGGVFVFLPLALIGTSKVSLALLWIGMIALNAYRLGSGFLRVRRVTHG